MKKMFLILGCLIFFFLIFYVRLPQNQSMDLNLQDSPELILTDRPSWAAWRAEGNGLWKNFLHFLDYQKKPKEMVFNPFPGQKAFFAAQKQLLANLPQPSDSEDYVRVGFVGDLMEVPFDKESFISTDVLSTLQQMDFVLGNLETPVSQSSTISKFRNNTLSQYNVLPDYLDALVINGKPVFQFLSLANNHILDRGDLGVEETIQNAEARGILVHGASQKKFALFNSIGIRFGVATATWGVNPHLSVSKSPIWYLPGIAPLDKSKIDLTQLKDALLEMNNAGIDFKILFLHWGYEYETYPDPLIQEIGRELIHSGADLIIGSHSHMLQPFELVHSNNHKGLIVYSMGNFVTTMANPFNRIGLLQELKVWRNSQQKIEWSLGASQLTQVTQGKHPKTEFIKAKPDKELIDAVTYYQHSLNLP